AAGEPPRSVSWAGSETGPKSGIAPMITAGAGSPRLLGRSPTHESRTSVQSGSSGSAAGSRGSPSTGSILSVDHCPDDSSATSLHPGQSVDQGLVLALQLLEPGVERLDR